MLRNKIFRIGDIPMLGKKSTCRVCVFAGTHLRRSNNISRRFRPVRLHKRAGGGTTGQTGETRR